MTYNIIYNNEIIDTTNNITDAAYLKKEYELAFTMFLNAAQEGHLEAQFSVGYSYNVGRGTAKDLPKAIEWLKQNGYKFLPLPM